MDDNCQECNGSGACDPCDGYGFHLDSYPGAGDGPECEFCAGSGICPDCRGEEITSTTGTTAGTDDSNISDQKVSA